MLLLLSSSMPCDSIIWPCPVGEGNWVSLKSVDADSKLLWRSSKLTDGRKSYAAPVVSPPAATSEPPPFLPKENREWLLDDDALSIGPPTDNRFVCERFVGLGTCLLLLLRQSTVSDRVRARLKSVWAGRLGWVGWLGMEVVKSFLSEVVTIGGSNHGRHIVMYRLPTAREIGWLV